MLISNLANSSGLIIIGPLNTTVPSIVIVISELFAFGKILDLLEVIKSEIDDNLL